MRVLVTGGAGYIGSHTCVELLNAGYEVVVIDNLANSSAESLRRVQDITGRPLTFIEADLRDSPSLGSLLHDGGFDAVIHFAGLKAVGESVGHPLAYYDNNLGGTISLCRAMASSGIKRLVFSSSATVYGDPHRFPIDEGFPLATTNPYGRTKLFIEQLLHDLAAADPDWDIALLRYFNPVGAHSSGRIGEDPQGIPNNLVPFIAQVAAGRLPELLIFGNDYATPDGTGVRDYIHVVDLARGHLAALDRLAARPGVVTYNLGTGRGYSVLEMVEAFAAAAGRPIPYRITARRPGDIAVCYADPGLAARELGWQARLGLAEMMRDTWRWQQANPQGYR
ncbi:MAG: UDP-glucose 4-epimerase GalE [Chromatiaceae bacterium]|nr:MAG: UDP-glucose 4-epimerase GalE [Chromatiaceae bacterium]